MMQSATRRIALSVKFGCRLNFFSAATMQPQAYGGHLGVMPGAFM
jgi:hypothetical protein